MYNYAQHSDISVNKHHVYNKTIYIIELRDAAGYTIEVCVVPSMCNDEIAYQYISQNPSQTLHDCAPN